MESILSFFFHADIMPLCIVTGWQGKKELADQPAVCSAGTSMAVPYAYPFSADSTRFMPDFIAEAHGLNIHPKALLTLS